MWLPSTVWVGNFTGFHGAVHSFWEWGYIKSFYNNAAFKTLFWFWMLVHNKILSTVIFFFFLWRSSWVIDFQYLVQNTFLISFVYT